jgi:hypothetical protein
MWEGLFSYSNARGCLPLVGRVFFIVNAYKVLLSQEKFNFDMSLDKICIDSYLGLLLERMEYSFEMEKMHYDKGI